MENPTPNAHDFKVKDSASYDELTQEFDLFTERFSLPLAQHLVALARLKPGEEVLDIGTGTGIVAFEAARAVAPSGRVVGIDFSKPMLATAQSKADRENLGDALEFRWMDAEALELPDSSFDVVVSLFALLHFPNPLVALREMKRVLRPGGRLVVAVGSGPPLNSPAGWMNRAQRVSHLPRQWTGRQLNAPDFLNALVEKHLPPTRKEEQSALASENLNRSQSVPALVQEAGFSEVRCDWRGHLAWLETPAEFWDLQRTYSSIARKRLNEAAPEKVEAVHQEFLQQCREVQARGGRLLYPYAAFYAMARRAPD